MTNEGLISVKDFSKRAGLSVARLYKLWEEGRGPRKVYLPGRGQGGVTAWVPEREGMEWAARRQRDIPAPWRRNGQLQRIAAQRQKLRRAQAKLAAREAVEGLYA